MGTLQTVYDHSPLFLQNLMCSVSGWQKYRERYGEVYHRTREFCKAFDNWTNEQQITYQEDALRSFIRFAYENSPFYNELYSGIDPDSIRTAEDLKRLPVVDKEMLRSNIERVFTVRSGKYVEYHTGGTTGKSLTVRVLPEDNEIRIAVLDHFKSRVGFESLKMRRATFNGQHIIPPGQKRHVYWRYNRPCRQMIYSSFDLTEDKIGYYVDSLNRFKPESIDGFFTSVCDVAGYIERHNCPLSFRPLAVFLTSETVNDEGRALIERVFRCKVYNQYASSEGAPFVTDCPEQHLHMERNTGIIEIQPNGEILVTSFTTRGTPLIRYAIGDVMVPEEPGFTCSCGLHGPAIKEILGRRVDFLYRPDGAKINSVNVANLLKYMPNSVIRAQFRQERLDEIEILLEMAGGVLDAEGRTSLLEKCRHTLGADMRVSIRVVDRIAREASGKFRLIVNQLPAPTQSR